MNVLLQGVNDATQAEAGSAGQVQNAAGGFVYPVDDWTRLRRFVLLGTDSGTYYAAPRPFTKDALGAVERCIAADPIKTLGVVDQIHMAGRAPKTDPALYVLAMLWQSKDAVVRKAIELIFDQWIRTGTMLLHFANFLDQLGNHVEGRATRRLIASWYRRDPDSVEYQVVKYPSRDKWSHRDLLRLSHAVGRTERHKTIYNWVTKGVTTPEHPGTAPISVFERAKLISNPTIRREWIVANNAFREQLPTEWLNDPLTWDALMDTDMPAMAMLRNLGTMASKGYLVPGSAGEAKVLNRLRNVERFARARVHPISVLMAARTYAQGKGERGHNTWPVSQAVTQALEWLFHGLFRSVEPTSKRILIALDVSGSMGAQIGGLPLTCREAAAAIGLVTYASEPHSAIIGFTASSAPEKQSIHLRYASMRANSVDPDEAVTSLAIERSWSLKQTTDYTANLDFGGTDCSAPMRWAMKHHKLVDAFITITDNETWAGPIHPSVALKEYRRESGVMAKSIVVAMTATGYSIADPADAGSLDVTGFDASVPSLISSFITDPL